MLGIPTMEDFRDLFVSRVVLGLTTGSDCGSKKEIRGIYYSEALTETTRNETVAILSGLGLRLSGLFGLTGLRATPLLLLDPKTRNEVKREARGSGDPSTVFIIFWTDYSNRFVPPPDDGRSWAA